MRVRKRKPRASRGRKKVASRGRHESRQSCDQRQWHDLKRQCIQRQGVTRAKTKTQPYSVERQKTSQSQRRRLKKMCRSKKGRDCLNQTGAPEDSPGQRQKASSPNEDTKAAETQKRAQANTNARRRAKTSRAEPKCAEPGHNGPSQAVPIQTGRRKKKYTGAEHRPKRAIVVGTARLVVQCCNQSKPAKGQRRRKFPRLQEKLQRQRQDTNGRNGQKRGQARTKRTHTEETGQR